MNAEWIESLRRKVESTRGYADTWCTLGQALAEAGELDEALSALDRAIQINPRYVTARISRCFVLGDLGKPARGYAAFRELSAATFHGFETVFGLGVYCMRHGWPDTGVAQLRRAQRIRPRGAFVGLHYAAALELAGDASAARVERGAATKSWHELLGDAGIPLDSTTPVDVDFARAWVDPASARLHVQRARFAAMHGREDDAMHELRAANSRYPGHPQLLVDTGRLFVALERFEEAERWLNVATEVDEACAEAHLELGFLMAGPERLDEALDHLQSAVELAPLYPDYRYQLGMILRDIGRAADAVPLFEQALILDPTNGHVALQLAATLHEVGEVGEALSILEAEPCRTWPEAIVLAAEIIGAEQPENARAMLDSVLEADPENQDAKRAREQLV